MDPLLNFDNPMDWSQGGGVLGLFELSLDASSDLQGLTVAVEALSHNVRTVRVDIYNSFTSRWLEPNVALLFDALGKIPGLRQVEFYGLRIFPYRMPISMAARTLRNATKLKEFSLIGVNLSALENMPAEFEEFSSTLKHHPSLVTFALDNCRLGVNGPEAPTLDEAIVDVLVEIPTLERVVVRAMENSMWGVLTCESVAKLCRSTRLKSLELFVFCEAADDLFAAAADALLNNTNSQLNALSISGCLGGMRGAQAISNLLEVNTRLRSLELHLRSRTEDEDEAGIIALSHALKRNKTLTKFQLHGASHRCGSLEVRESFLNMLQKNYSLTASVQVFHPGFLRPESDFYLKLNQVGRGRLLGNVNAEREKWIDAMVRVRENVDCLYYFLHTNPSLCSCSSSSIKSLVAHSNETAVVTPCPEKSTSRKRKLDQTCWESQDCVTPST